MGVILSGALDDGTYGLKVIKDAGGVAVVQDPAEAEVPSMPRNAIEAVNVDHVLRASAIGQLIAASANGTQVTAREADMARSREPEPQDPRYETEVDDMMTTYGPP